VPSLTDRIRGVPAQYTTDASVTPTRRQLAEIAKIARTPSEIARDFAAIDAVARGEAPESSEEYRIIAEICERKGMLEPEHARMRSLFRRWDNLYFPEDITEPGGPDHWAPKPGSKNGRVHISLNSPPPYVDIPAAMQAVPPVENYIPASGSDDDRSSAGRAERLYMQWKEEIGFELLVHKAAVTKGLYGHTYGKVWWDALEKMPQITVLESPENLYVGWGDSDFRRMDWAIYCYGLSPQSAEEIYGVEVEGIAVDDGRYVPYVSGGNHADPLNQIGHGPTQTETTGGRMPTAYEQLQVEVYDYWYRKYAGKGKRPEIWNAIYVGNKLVEKSRHKEYDDLPYVLLPNTYIPGYPYGRPELYDLEQLIREKDERLSEAGQMIHSAVGGQMWQIVGAGAPDTVSDNMIPKANKVATPGPDAEIKTINPYVPAFPVEEYLKRLDYETTGLSGLNDMLMGRAPLTALGSSKAVNALVAMYGPRMAMKRDLLYQWRKRVWKIAATVWERKDSEVKQLIDGQYAILVTAPDLTPRDALENAQKVINLVQNRLISMERAMDEVGVDDPETEKDIIREEQTDPALNAAAVQAQVGLAATMRELGMDPNAPPQEAGAPAPTQEQARNTARQTNRPAAGGESLNAPENQGNPPEESLPENAGQAQVQTMIQGGDASNRVLTQTPISGEY
jgi:hypothetical protein